MQEPNKIKFAYISDIHLNYQIAKYHPFSHKRDTLLVNSRNKSIVDGIAEKIGRNFLKSRADYLLVGGDTASDVNTEHQFFARLIEFVDPTKIIVILGNHEFWSTPNKPYKQDIVDYKENLKCLGITVLENDLLYFKDNKPFIIQSLELEHMTPEDVGDTIKNSPFAIFGAIGFSGLKQNFSLRFCNAYGYKITNEEEKRESEYTDYLYMKLTHVDYSGKFIVLTHMSVRSWSIRGMKSGFIYVNGHSHFNHKSHGKSYLNLANNQVGYKPLRSFRLKSFEI
jgi:predicted MPP superfamily phosphohydrolase